MKSISNEKGEVHIMGFELKGDVLELSLEIKGFGSKTGKFRAEIFDVVLK